MFKCLFACGFKPFRIYMINKVLSASLFFIAFISINTTMAQEGQLRLSYQAMPDKSVDFNFEKFDPGAFTVVLTLTNLTNSSAYERREFTAKGYAGNLTSLTPLNKEQRIGFSYKYSYIRGKLQPRYDAGFVYLLPYKKGNKVRATESTFLGATYFGNTTPDDWKAYRFYTPGEDTVTAIRKGIVVLVKDLYETDNLENVAYKSTQNELIIEHADGTLATYKGFKKGSFTVKLGQTVFPGTALGVNSKYSSDGKYNISLMVTYLKSADFESKQGQTLRTSKSLYGFITPHFCTTESADMVLTTQTDYVAADAPEIVKKELTKKEIKLLGK